MFPQLQDSLWDDMYFGAEESHLLSDPHQPLLPKIHDTEDPFPCYDAGSGTEDDVISHDKNGVRTIAESVSNVLPKVGGASAEKDPVPMENEVDRSLVVSSCSGGGASHASLFSPGDLSDNGGDAESERFQEKVSLWIVLKLHVSFSITNTG